MIKINLVGERKRPVAPAPAGRAPTMEGANLGNWALIGLVALAALVALGHMLILNGKVKGKEEEVAVAKKEVEELEPYIRQVEEYKAKKAELERKVQVINQLKENQRGPVRVMDHISRALPELLWLSKMEVGPGTITLSGEAFNTNAVANLIENLDRVPEFQEPILKDTQQQGQIYTFTISFSYSYQIPTAEGAEGEESEAVVQG